MTELRERVASVVYSHTLGFPKKNIPAMYFTTAKQIERLILQPEIDRAVKADRERIVKWLEEKACVLDCCVPTVLQLAAELEQGQPADEER